MVRRILLGFVGLLVALIAGAFIFLSDPDVPRDVLVAKYAGPPSQFLTLPAGATVHYRDQGSRTGPVLILVHGSNDSLLTWEKWAAILGDEFRVISLDLPSHGLTVKVPGDDYSQKGLADFVLALADALQVETFAIAGNSLGGAVAARLAGEHPERVTKLILIDAGGMFPPGKREIPLGFQLMRTPVVRELFRFFTPRSLFESGLTSLYVNDALVTPELVDRYWELNRAPGNREAGIDRASEPLDEWIAGNLARITAPTLILWGREDRLTPLSIGEAYRDGLPRAQMIVYDDAGHLPQEEIAARTAGDARAFLAGP
ncbi:MAG: alpha/beta fold hydrolase [Alphaproteobacteria bacterium]|nr:alpha/beta fold hydrolase [Alphaproteobacteria bacterium]